MLGAKLLIFVMIVVHGTLASCWFNLFQGIFEFLSLVGGHELSDSLNFSWTAFRWLNSGCSSFWPWFWSIWFSSWIENWPFGHVIEFVLLLRSCGCKRVFLLLLGVWLNLWSLILTWFSEERRLRLFGIFVSLFSDRLCKRLLIWNNPREVA